MAIYSEDTDPNQNVKTSKEITIDKINEIIKEYGNFTIADVEADSSPFLDTKGKLTHLAEEFMEGNCVVYVYDPTSHSSDEIDKYDEFYEEFEEPQLDYILELAEKWVEINSEDEVTKVMFYVATYPASELDEQPHTEVLAVFPELNDNDISFNCYANLGQHSICHRDFIKNNCKDATKEQYNNLFLELESIGYNLEVLNAN